MKTRAAFMAAICLAQPGMTGDPSAFGIWCGPEGDAMEIDADGLRNFEHTICDWGLAQTEQNKLDAELRCKSRHWDGSTMIETQHRIYQFKARLLSRDELEVDYSDGRPPAVLHRCNL